MSRFLLQHTARVHQGKVRDTYKLPDPGRILVVATDRLSIFDYVLNAKVWGKGKYLTGLTDFNLTSVLKGFRHHLVASRGHMREYMPKSLSSEWAIASDLGLLSQALVVKRVQPLLIECVVRGYITGSGYRDYRQTGEVCGIKLPSGLNDSDRLPNPIFTPATKAQVGHDKNISMEEAAKIVGWPLLLAMQRLSLALYDQGHAYALARGIVLADTKFEFGLDEKGQLVLIDEVLTPDSSRYWWLHHWCEAPHVGKPPSGYDKEPVRIAGKTAILPDGRVVDISKFEDPDDPEQIRIVQSWQVPEEILRLTTERYRTLMRMLGVSER